MFKWYIFSRFTVHFRGVYSESDKIWMQIFTINFSTYSHSYAVAIDGEKQEKYSIQTKEYKHCLYRRR